MSKMETKIGAAEEIPEAPESWFRAARVREVCNCVPSRAQMYEAQRGSPKRFSFDGFMTVAEDLVAPSGQVAHLAR